MEGLIMGQPTKRGRIHSPRSKSFGTKLTQSEEDELVVAAKKHGNTASEWVREVLLREARKPESDPVFTEIVATRMLLNLVLKHIACGERLTAEMFTAVLSTVRTTKQKQAVELMQQYTSADEKES